LHRRIVSFLICLFPLVLLIDPRSTFYVDWFNHLWTIEYFGEYFRQHGALSPILVTKDLVGIVMPIFYGGKFYLAVGLISRLTGSAIAFRIVALLTMLIQFWYVKRAVRSAGGGRFLSLTVATIVCWAIYPLTNLYNRSALTEFVAVGFLTAAVASFFVLVIRLSDRRESYYDAVSFGLMYSAAAVTHPLTALFGCTFLIPMGFVAFVSLRRMWLLGVGVFNLIMTAVVLGPWLYVLHRFGRFLTLTDPMTTKMSFRKVAFFPNSIDSFWSRISPVPIDFRSTIKGVDVSTPYLEAQIMFPLLLVAAVLVWLWLRPFGGLRRPSQPLLLTILFLSVSLFFLLFALSVDPDISAWFIGFFDILQFPYRLTSYINLTLMTCVFCLTGLAGPERCGEGRVEPGVKNLILVASLTISFSALVTKLIDANAIRFDDPIANIRKRNAELGLRSQPDLNKSWYPGMPSPAPCLINLPTTFYGYSAYSVTSGFSKTLPAEPFAKRTLAFVPGDSRSFGVVDRIRVEVPTPTLIVTNVQAFPWNVLFVDKVRVPGSKVYVLQSDAFAKWIDPKLESVLLPAGAHVLQYRFLPDRKWRILDRISWVVLCFWVILSIFVGILCWRQKCGSVEGSAIK
jgi:hypothetical protein